MKSQISICFLLIASAFAQQQPRSISSSGSRRNRFSAGKSQALNFNCPEDFGYYSHPTDCSQYYVCVFGGALLESCTGGLQYSTDLQTCDWPRNVVCNQRGGSEISTVQITDPRTQSRSTKKIHSATESLSASNSLLSRGIDNSIRSRQPVKTSGTSKSIFDDSKIRQGRFVSNQDHQRIDNGFQAQETSSRSFNVVPAAPTQKSGGLSFPSNIPVANTNRFSQVRGAAPQTEKPFYSDLLNLTDSDYYYYYDDILYDDYYEPVAPKATTTQAPRRPVVRTPSRSRATPEHEKPFTQNNLVAQVDNRRRGSSRSNPSTSPLTSSLPTSSSLTSSRSSRDRGGPSSAPVDGQSSQRSRNSQARGSSRQKPKATKASPAPGGSPQLIGRTPLRLLRPSKKPKPSSTRTKPIVDIWKYPPRRPAPIYPQPQPDLLAATCDRNICKLPDCSCGGAPVPGNIAPQNVPQMVLLTFDDSVNDLNKKLYVDLFERGRVNPNGCPISATFYISHEWTDYSQVQNLYSDGHEIASHSITHSFGEKFSTKKWAQEIGGQREIMSAYGGVRMEDIRGMRAPFLAVGGNNMFRMLYDLNFTYDSSMPVYENNPPSWPYTLDYKIFHDCMIAPCPTKSYPGVWQVPMVMWQDLAGGRCSMADACTTPATAEDVYKLLTKNFERHYTTNRAPFTLFYHAAWFTTPHHKEGFIAFLDTISAMDDVWIVTNWQTLQWVRNPVPLQQAKSFAPFQCDYPERPPRCTSPRVCNVWHKGSVRYLKTCYTCPETYPWTGNTGVQSPLNNL